MGVKEDQSEFENTGWRGVLKRLMKSKSEGFIKLDAAGWRGEEVATRPAPGSGPYIHFRGGEAIRMNNATPDDKTSEEVKWWI